MSFSDEERAELIAALSLTADMVGILLSNSICCWTHAKMVERSRMPKPRS